MANILIIEDDVSIYNVLEELSKSGCSIKFKIFSQAKANCLFAGASEVIK